MTRKAWIIAAAVGCIFAGILGATTFWHGWPRFEENQNALLWNGAVVGIFGAAVTSSGVLLATPHGKLWIVALVGVIVTLIVGFVAMQRDFENTLEAARRFFPE